MSEEHWLDTPERDLVPNRSNRMGTLNMALLFGTAAIALTLIVTPMLAPDRSANRMQASTMDYDNITTGSVPSGDGKTKRYTIRRSILQKHPGDVCIIDENGRKNGC